MEEACGCQVHSVYTLVTFCLMLGASLRRLTIAIPSATPTPNTPLTNNIGNPATVVAVLGGCRCGGGGQGKTGLGAVAGRRVSSCLRNRSPTSQPCIESNTARPMLSTFMLAGTQTETFETLGALVQVKLCGMSNWPVKAAIIRTQCPQDRP